MTGVDWAPREVSFRHPTPRSTAEHQRIFRAPVRFGRPSNEQRRASATTGTRAVAAKPVSPSSIYALSKLDQERMCLLIGQAYGMQTVAPMGGKSGGGAAAFR